MRPSRRQLSAELHAKFTSRERDKQSAAWMVRLYRKVEERGHREAVGEKDDDDDDGGARVASRNPIDRAK